MKIPGEYRRVKYKIVPVASAADRLAEDAKAQDLINNPLLPKLLAAVNALEQIKNIRLNPGESYVISAAWIDEVLAIIKP